MSTLETSALVKYIFRTRLGIKSISVISNYMTLILPQTKFEAIARKYVAEGDVFLAEADMSRQI